jgi:CBS domain-containing protein/gamma-glutamylcysteine synthetase
MGDKYSVDEGQQLREFTRRLLADLRALERMLRKGLFETGVRRIGAEQEVFLVDRDGNPACAVQRMLEAIQDPHFVTEVAQFNLEANLDPQDFGGDCLSRMERQLEGLLGKARRAAAPLGLRVVMTGILPTIRKGDLALGNMTPIPRYLALNRAMTRLRGREFEFTLKGVDELHLRHDSVMVEACNASFQVHLQVDPAAFARTYNAAQAVAGPVLAACTNSPLLFGRRLWQETRIALFQQSVDVRGRTGRESAPRVDFGTRWVKSSVLELFQEGVSRHRVLIATEPEEDPFAKLDRGEMPDLRALRLHNGTIYRWNRACYGVIDGKPHLRIEARMLPSGPSVADEIANAAFWLGLMEGMEGEYGDVTTRMSFDDAKANFLNAARQGLGASLTWLDGETHPAPALLLGTLIPLARKGLQKAGVDTPDAERCLSIIEERVKTGCTGSRWMQKSFQDMASHGTESERLHALTAAIAARQEQGLPVSRWPFATLAEAGGWEKNYLKVEQFMSTDFVTVQEGDPVELVADLMLWERVRHVPVEDDEHRIVGLVSYRGVLRALRKPDGGAVAVSEIMKKDPWVIAPDSSTLAAVEIIRKNDVGCLPVVRDGRLVGVVTLKNFMGIAAELLEQKLKG